MAVYTLKGNHVLHFNDKNHFSKSRKCYNASEQAHNIKCFLKEKHFRSKKKEAKRVNFQTNKNKTMKHTKGKLKKMTKEFLCSCFVNKFSYMFKSLFIPCSSLRILKVH